MNELAKLIKYGKIRSKEAKNYHNKIKYAYLTGTIMMDGVSYDVAINIRKVTNGQNKFYIHALSIKKETNLS